MSKAPPEIEKKRSYTHYDPKIAGEVLELSKHWSPDSTPPREIIMKTTYPVNQ